MPQLPPLQLPIFMAPPQPPMCVQPPLIAEEGWLQHPTPPEPAPHVPGKHEPPQPPKPLQPPQPQHPLPLPLSPSSCFIILIIFMNFIIVESSPASHVLPAMWQPQPGGRRNQDDNGVGVSEVIVYRLLMSTM